MSCCNNAEIEQLLCVGGFAGLGGMMKEHYAGVAELAYEVDVELPIDAVG